MAEFVKEVIASPLAPAAIGPYSQAIRAGGMLYVSGCIGMCHVEKKLVSGGVEIEARKVLDNMRNILEAGGSRLDLVVKCTVLLTNISDFPAVNAIYAEYFPTEPPARATFAVTALPAGALIEIDCIAICAR